MNIQSCENCDLPTGRSESNSIYIRKPIDSNFDYGPLCEGCAEKLESEEFKRASTPNGYGNNPNG